VLRCVSITLELFLSPVDEAQCPFVEDVAIYAPECKHHSIAHSYAYKERDSLSMTIQAAEFKNNPFYQPCDEY
jgi:hypothetical protein